ncbi:MAG: hypothetical protein LDL06_05040 [Candidatus Nitrosotenuis sp.]|nr:hypothetical protein [Candidatus Nitrosotenuis sp.]
MKLDSFAISILRKMYFYGYIGGKHTSTDNLQKSFPKHERGNVKVAVKTLIKANLIIPKSTGYGQHCSLNPRMIDEIEKLIEE